MFFAETRFFEKHANVQNIVWVVYGLCMVLVRVLLNHRGESTSAGWGGGLRAPGRFEVTGRQLTIGSWAPGKPEQTLGGLRALFAN